MAGLPLSGEEFDQAVSEAEDKASLERRQLQESARARQIFHISFLVVIFHLGTAGNDK
jgi:hypothetical protein